MRLISPMSGPLRFPTSPGEQQHDADQRGDPEDDGHEGEQSTRLLRNRDSAVAVPVRHRDSLAAAGCSRQNRVYGPEPCVSRGRSRS